MKERTEISITNDMIACGIDSVTAKKIAKGKGLVDSAAIKFVNDNKTLVKLTPEQEKKLLLHIVPGYEKRVKSAMKVDLLQHQFDALVCFAYNSGGRFNTVTRNINQGKIADAMKAIKKANTSRGKVMSTLVTRREHEVSLYLYGDYGKLRTI